MTGSSYHPLTVAETHAETHDSMSVLFDIPAELKDTFTYKAGQFLTLRLEIEGKRVPRCYSMSSSPTEDGNPRVSVKRVDGGRGSNWICDNVKAGDVIEVMAPSGVFTPKDINRDFVLYGGGSGITPVLSILRTALATGTGKVKLFYANRDEQSIMFKSVLDDLQAQYADRLTVQHWLDSEKGIVPKPELANFALDMPMAEVFICGPAPFMDAVESALDMAGFNPDSIHVERFVSLPDEGDEQQSSVDASAADAAVVSVDLYGERHELPVKEGETILQAAQRLAVDMPFSCQAGLCAACMCKLEDGTVEMESHEALSGNDIEKGWVLTCKAKPTSAEVRIKFI